MKNKIILINQYLSVIDQLDCLGAAESLSYNFPLTQPPSKLPQSEEALWQHINDPSFHKISMKGDQLLNRILWLRDVLFTGISNGIYSLEWVNQNFFLEVSSGWFFPKLNFTQAVNLNNFRVADTFQPGDQTAGTKLLQKHILESKIRGHHVIGLAAGAASGKTSFVTIMRNAYQDVQVIMLEGFYKSRAERDEKALYGKESINLEVLLDILHRINAGASVAIPIYDREKGTIRGHKTLPASNMYMLDGIYPFAFEEADDLIDTKITLWIPDKERLRRQLIRDSEMRLPEGVSPGHATPDQLKAAEESIRKRFFQKIFRDQFGLISPQLGKSDIILDVENGRLLVNNKPYHP